VPEFLIILLVVGFFLGVFFLVSVVRERELLRDERRRSHTTERLRESPLCPRPSARKSQAVLRREVVVAGKRQTGPYHERVGGCGY
jgi:hypothetical protein